MFIAPRTMFNALCMQLNGTAYNVQCTAYVHCTAYYVQCTAYNVECTLYNYKSTGKFKHSRQLWLSIVKAKILEVEGKKDIYNEISFENWLYA